MMPVLFIGHGHPLNAIQRNEFTTALNQASAVLGCLTFAQGVHPFPVYAELCRIVGMLSIFDETRRTPDIPRYDHDDLARIFKWVDLRIRELAVGTDKPDRVPYEQRFFEGRRLGMRVKIIDEYNRIAGEIAEPYRYLVVADFPANVTEDAAARMGRELLPDEIQIVHAAGDGAHVIHVKREGLDLLTAFSARIAELFDQLRDWLIRFSPQPLEVLFWLAVLWVGVGLIRPRLDRPLWAEIVGDPRQAAGGQDPLRAALYPAFRNTLMVVLVLFAVYLVFEFQTLWLRVFPQGFHYSGYAHEGAAWLTVALALATVVLSLVFRGDVLRDERLPRLKRLAWLWSLENVLLAIAVYHRLFIYIGFNGMTRMRIVGLYGMSAVVVGFLLVLRKIARHHDFVWLVRRHLWTVAVAVFLLAVTPVDMIVVSYDVRRILSGDPAPCVQISVHPISSEGVLLLPPLLECRDETIREGIRAMPAVRHEQAERSALLRQQQGWTSYQIADQLLLGRLRSASGQWAEYTDRNKREEMLKRFHAYAYQWY